MNPKNENETKTDIFLRDIFKLDSYQTKLKYFSYFQNQNFSNLWLKWTQTIEIKQNQTVFHGIYSNLVLLFIGRKMLKYSMTFIIGTFQSQCKSEHNQIKWNKITRDMCKTDSIFFIYKIVHHLNDFWNLFLDKIYLYSEW